MEVKHWGMMFFFSVLINTLGDTGDGFVWKLC